VDSREAREILACYRPGLDDPADPQFAEALAQVRHDPELARWLEDQSVLDAAVRSNLRQIPVPAELRDRIVGGPQARPAVVVRWQRRASVAAAVAAVVLAAITSVWLGIEANTFAAYRQKMAGLVSAEYQMDFKSNDVEKIRDYLALRGSPSDYALTPGMQKLEAEGGGIINWHGRKVSLVCLEAGEDEDIFLFIVGRGVMPDAPATASPQFARVGKMMTATWSVGDKLYLLAGRGDEEALRGYL